MTLERDQWPGLNIERSRDQLCSLVYGMRRVSTVTCNNEVRRNCIPLQLQGDELRACSCLLLCCIMTLV